MVSFSINNMLLQYQRSRSEDDLRKLMEEVTPNLKQYLEAVWHHRGAHLSNIGDDLNQEMWIQVVRQIGQYKGPEGFAWLCKILQGVVSQHFRYKYRAKRPRTEAISDKVMEDITTDEPKDGFSSVERQQVQVEGREFVERMLSHLNTPTREMLRMFYFKRMSQREIGEIYHISESTVLQRIKNARTKLKRDFAKTPK